MWQVGDKMSWCLAFLAGYLNGFILYFMFQFDQNPYWIRKDLHYTIICIALPAFIGNSQMYRPRNTMVMIFIGLMLIEGIIVSALWNGFLIRVISHPIQGMQTQAIAEIIADDFRLVGTSFAMHKIQQQHNVRRRLDKNKLVHFLIRVFCYSIQMKRRQCSVCA